MKQLLRITNTITIEVNDDAQILPTTKSEEPRARTVLDANKDKTIIDADAQQQTASYDKKGRMVSIGELLNDYIRCNRIDCPDCGKCDGGCQE